MAVVAALELDDEITAGGAPRETDGAHGRLRPRGDQTHHLHGRHRGHDEIGQLDLARGRRAIARAPREGLPHRLDHGGGGVAQDERAPRAEEIDVGAAVDIRDAAALGAPDEEGSAAHAAKGPDGTVDAAGKHTLGPAEERFRARSRHGAGQDCGRFQSKAMKSPAAGSQRKAPASTTRPSITESTT